MKKKAIKKTLLDFLFLLIGGFIWACSLRMFTVPNLIVPGGFSGLATILHHFFAFPVGITTLILNLPLFVLSFHFRGIRFTVKTFLATTVTSLLVDFCTFLPEFTEDKLLAAVFGGILTGFGFGLIYMRDMATGGTDLLAAILKKWIHVIPYGNLVFLIDAVIVAISVVAFRDLAAALYAVITIYITSVIVDHLLGGLDKGKAVYIISSEREKISDIILADMDRGVTRIRAVGEYTEKEQDMLMVIIRRNELHHLKTIVAEIDPRAFVVVSDVTEILGSGFKDIETQK